MPPTAPAALTSVLTPQGHLLLAPDADEVGTALPAAFAFWRDFAARYVTLLCTAAAAADATQATAPPCDEFARRIADAPPLTGAEYLTVEVLVGLWTALDAALRIELDAAGVPLQDFLKSRHAAWNLVGRVHFNLAENRQDAEAPFAFLATYTTQLSAHGKAQHQPLAQAGVLPPAAKKASAKGKVLDVGSLADMFGIEMAAEPVAAQAHAAGPSRSPPRAPRKRIRSRR